MPVQEEEKQFYDGVSHDQYRCHMEDLPIDEVLEESLRGSKTVDKVEGMSGKNVVQIWTGQLDWKSD